MSDIEKTPAFEGNDRLLLGLILSVLTFWLFAQTMLNVAPVMGKELGADSSMMNIAVSSAALFSGIFTVVMGGLADRIGRMRIMVLGLWCSMVGSLAIALTPVGALSMPVLLLGRVLQGFSAACIMPASLALVKTYWDGAARQRAVSLWSIGTWGGSSLCSLFGGLVAEDLENAIIYCHTALSLVLLHMNHAPAFVARPDRHCDWCPYASLCAS